MSKAAIKKQIGQLKKKIEKSPRVLRFRGKRVVSVDSWQLEDWTTFPDQYHIGFSLWLHPPDDWWNDYVDLLWRLEDSTYAWQVCMSCAIHNAQGMKQVIDRAKEHWAKQGGKQKFYDCCEKAEAEKFRLNDAIEQMKFRILNEQAGANDRTCDVLNFFNCPYGKEYLTLIKAGGAAQELFTNLDWYHTHWHRDLNSIPSQSEMKWYHYSDSEIIDLTNFEDVKKAAEDGRVRKIATEREAYSKAMA